MQNDREPGASRSFSCAAGGGPALKGEPMRLDKYLKVSRLIKRRTVANEACDSGRVLINDKPAKASANVKEGDIITISFGNKEVKVEVLDVQETVRKEEAKELFRYI
jgi:ribosomal 50S subunit-recycling heat shock protein